MARWVQREEIITTSTDWPVPYARDNKFNVSIWGGGGSGATDGSIGNFAGGGGGAAGEMKSMDLTLTPAEFINIRIGQGGQGIKDAVETRDYCGYVVGQSGGTTMFGNYMMANGGGGAVGATGGIGAHNGGNAGMDAEGHYIGYGVSYEVGGIQVASGGGAGAVNARGAGGCANRASGNGGTGAGGCGCFVEMINGVPHRRIGSGGNGVCVIRYDVQIGR